MTGRISLVEQKKLQWAKERDEIARLNDHWESVKNQNPVRTTIRTKLSSREQSCNRKPIRASGHYGSTTSLRSLEIEPTSLRSLEFSAGGSMINILDRTELSGPIRKRSPSLPPIYTKGNNPHRHTYNPKELSELEPRDSHYGSSSRGQKHNQPDRSRNIVPPGVPYEEREDETSGYASDSIEAPVRQMPRGTDSRRLRPLDKVLIDAEMSERTWQNPYCESPETSLPSSRRFSITRLGELNRPRWGGMWERENSRDPPPPSWLERGLSRLDNTSQILVINHDSASSPDSSTTGSSGSDLKTYLRGQNIPMDAHMLQERETRRQRALELQNAIKQQLEEKDKKRKEERERKLQEEREEEERIKRERVMEKEKFEEEQRRIKAKEEAKLKKEETMREILESAERLAREEKRQRRQREDFCDVKEDKDSELTYRDTLKNINEVDDHSSSQKSQIKTETRISENPVEQVNNGDDGSTSFEKKIEDVDKEELTKKLLRLPVNKEVAIVLTGRLEDSDLLSDTNLQLLNLVVNSRRDNNSSILNSTLNAFVKSLGHSNYESPSSSLRSPRNIENRLLTPSKYRNCSGRDFGTQTDGENDSPDIEIKENCKNRKEIVTNCRKDTEKSTNTSSMEEKSVRSKSQPRPTLDSRPRWNANRPGTRYRTQSEKDPHYQRRLRLRRRRVESSDDRSRSPSCDRRKLNNIKSKRRNSARRRVKQENYDADLSMDSLNSVIPLRIDKHGRINLELTDNKSANIVTENHSFRNVNDEVEGKRQIQSNENVNLWCGQEIMSQLASLRNGLLLKQREWDPERCLVSPSTDFC